MSSPWFLDLLKKVPFASYFRERVEVSEAQARLADRQRAIAEAQCAVVEQENAKLKVDNLSLQKRLDEALAEIAHLNDELAKGIHFFESLEFLKREFVYKDKMDGSYYCASCVAQKIRSRLRDCGHGWQCETKGCEKFWPNSDKPQPGPIATGLRDHPLWP